MKFRIGPHPDEATALVVVVRDGPSGQDKSTTTIQPGDYADIEFDRDDRVAIENGAEIEPKQVEEGDEDEAPATLQTGNPTVAETLRATAFDQAKAAGASNAEALKAADAVAPPVDPETQQPSEQHAPDADASDPAAAANPEPSTDDTATGGEGDDTAAAGAGDDTTSSGSGDDTVAGGESADQTGEPRDPTDEEVLQVMRDLETAPSVERTQQGHIMNATLREALEARGFKPISAAKGRELMDANGLTKPPQ